MSVGLVVIPALNEAASIGPIIDDVQRLTGLEVLVVDDNSTDSTATLARAKGARVLSLPLRLGAWGAIQTGIRYANRGSYKFVVTLDADGQHEPEYVNELVRTLIETGADVAIGACTDRGSLLRKIAWRYFQNLTGFPIEDLTSGFRAYSRRAIDLLAEVEATLLDYQDVGVLLMLRQADLKIVEVPVTMQLRSSGTSRVFGSWFGVTKYMLETTIICFSHLLPNLRKRQ